MAVYGNAGVFPPVEGPEGRWYIDGGIVNPVPVSLCRALGADVVIAVNLNNDLLRRVDIKKQEKAEHKKKPSEVAKIFAKARNLIPAIKKEVESDKPKPPDFFETISRSINIAQDRITKTRLAGDPPEIILCPKVSDIGLLETYRAEEAIRAGYKCCEANIAAIKDGDRSLKQYVLGLFNIGGKVEHSHQYRAADNIADRDRD